MRVEASIFSRRCITVNPIRVDAFILGEVVWRRWKPEPRTFPLLHYYPVRTDTKELWEEGNVMLGFDAEERIIQRLPQLCRKENRLGLAFYPHHDTTTGWTLSTS